MEEIINVGLCEIFEGRYGQEIFNDEILVSEINGAQAHILNTDALPVRFSGYSVILACRGEMRAEIDYIPRTLKKNCILELLSFHIFDKLELSPDFKGYHVVISTDIYDSVMKTTALSEKLMAVQGRMEPLWEMEDNDMLSMLSILDRIIRYINMDRHSFQSNIIRTEIATFMLELGNIELKNAETYKVQGESQHIEGLISRFIKLLVANCLYEDEVSFYAGELCITPEYLSRILKSFSGRPAHVWIKEARIAEAKILLRRPESTIGETAEALGFSDQSAFGKFFKKHTGQSPGEYKKSLAG